MPQTNPSLSAQNNHHVCSSQPYSMTVWLGTDGVVLVSARLLPFSIFCSPKWHLVHLSGVDWLLAKVMWWQNHMSLLLRPAWACSMVASCLSRGQLEVCIDSWTLALEVAQRDSCAACYWPSESHVQPRWKEQRSGLHLLMEGAIKSYCRVVAIFAHCSALKVSSLWAMSLSQAILTQLENIIRKRSVTTMMTTFVLNRIA